MFAVFRHSDFTDPAGLVSCISELGGARQDPSRSAGGALPLLGNDVCSALGHGDDPGETGKIVGGLR